MTGDLQRVVGRNLRRIRTGRGVTQEALGESIGRHRTYVGGIERGERNLALQTVESVADALGVDAFALLARDD
ncbi:helix-turn-helix domain-containing protein [Cellulomonas sp. Marseille-Q8402]